MMTLLQILLTFMFLLILMKLSKVELEKISYTILFGLSVILGLFAFQLVIILVIIFTLFLIVMAWIGRRAVRRVVNPEHRRLEEDGRD